MKKLMTLILIFIATVLIATADDEKFYGALQNCTPYRSSGESTTDGIRVKFMSQITGKNNDKCIYKETVNYGDTEMCVTCSLTKAQTNELVNVMRSFSVIQQYSGSSVDTSSVKAVQDNPVVKVWNKYLQDPNVCKIEGLK